jgi:Na+/serine symporter
MTPRAIDLGIIGDVAEDTFEGGSTVLIRYAALLVVVVGVLYLVYWLTNK